jgi:hypothetical protein
MSRKQTFVSILIALLFTMNAIAQTNDSTQQAPKRSTGISIAYGSTTDIALRTKISKKIFLRPIIGIDRSSSNNASKTSNYSYDIYALTLEFGLEMLHYFSIGEVPNDLRTYFGYGPKLYYQEQQVEYNSSNSYKYLTVERGYGCSAFFGTEYWFGDKFGTFGELGLSYKHTSGLLESTGYDKKTNDFSTFVKFGINFIF